VIHFGSKAETAECFALNQFSLFSLMFEGGF